MNIRNEALPGFPLILVTLACLAVSPLVAQTAVYIYDASGNTTAAGPGGATAPTITSQPQSQLLQNNGLVTFSVVGGGVGLAYQWFSNGVALPGATGDSLQLSNLSGTNFGSYTVRLSNGSGSVTSAPAAIWPDSNGNGLPDWWEMQYFGNLNQTASGDFDGDGVSNFDEYVEGTNPADPTSLNPRLRIQSVHGSVAVSPFQPYYTNGQFVTLTASPDVGHAFLSWGGAAAGTKTRVSLLMDTNKLAIANFGLSLPSALDNASVVWTTGGDAPWFGQAEVSYDGFGAAQSGPIVSYWNGSTFVGAQSWLQTVTNCNQTLQLGFWWAVSSRPPDALTFYIDGTAVAALSGETLVWQQFQTNLLAGNHTLTWNYTKGPVDIPTGIPFLDSGWVDQVSLTSTNVAPQPPPMNVGLTSTNTVLVAWPAPSTGFVLQQNPDPATTNWVNSTNSVNLAGSQKYVIIPPTGQHEFYRLIYQ
jgi:List-Bact-rpt repeat protein